MCDNLAHGVATHEALPGKSSRVRFFTGVRDCYPVLLGYIPVGLAFGVVARTSGLSVAEVGLMSLLLYAGSAQFILVGLFTAGASVIATTVTVALVNIRHLLYSAALAPRLNRAPLWQNALVGAQLTDETFAFATGRLSPGEKADHAWIFGVQMIANLTWISSTMVGARLGQAIGNVSAFGLDYALTASFAALLVLQVRNHR
jgi:4-azaleucine resistance transporter AzlC